MGPTLGSIFPWVEPIQDPVFTATGSAYNPSASLPLSFKGTPSDSARLSLSWTLSSPLDVPVLSLGDLFPSSFLKKELLQIELVMVSRVAKRVPPSCSLFVACRLYILYRQVFHVP